MQLIRWGNAYCTKAEDKIYIYNENGENSVRVAFRSFGQGYLRTSDFSVKFTWDDVKALIQEHAKLDHPEAVRLRDALRLADAVEEAGWQAPDAQKSN